MYVNAQQIILPKLRKAKLINLKLDKLNHASANSNWL